MNSVDVKVLQNKKIALDTYEMILQPPHMEQILPGQFINIQIKDFMLRRPISVCSVDEATYTIIYKVVGEGTEKMSILEEGDTINVLQPLGSSFPIHEELEKVLLVGGGVGVPPLYEVAKQYRNLNKEVQVVLGFNDKASVFYETEFQRLGCTVVIATMDGSYGCKGTVLDAIEKYSIQNAMLYSCGPMPMLQALDAVYTSGYVSFEARMACGFGACMGCVCKDKEDKELYYRICKEGPVFEIGKVGFEC